MYNIGTHSIDIFPSSTHHQGLEKDLKTAIGAIYSCGIVIDETLFCKVFGIDAEVLKVLENLGLIFYEKGSWLPHDSLMEIVEKEAVKIEPELTNPIGLSNLKINLFILNRLFILS